MTLVVLLPTWFLLEHFRLSTPAWWQRQGIVALYLYFNLKLFPKYFLAEKRQKLCLISIMVAHLYYVDPVLFLLLDADFFRLFTQNGEKGK
jgi:hypothetical protein